ncbi:unnamed protein product [Polarella glacialis]|uniref:PCIF1 WW domain-containing protein n=1 Tax=Polarella glacialis TaxID=89957 RepID=A0A813EVN3_POLGL|nr:unnamed protein product [Polarella glacialis]
MSTKSHAKRARSQPFLGRHDHTAAPSSGEAVLLASEGSPRTARCQLWADVRQPPPQWAPPVAAVGRLLQPEAAASLEIQVAVSVHRLRKRLAELCKASGLKAKLRPLTFERWRFASKWEEGMASSAPKDTGKKRKRSAGSGSSSHPVLPGHVPAGRTCSADKDLATELQRQGLSSEAASSAAREVRRESLRLAAEVCKTAHRVSSGKSLPAPLLKARFHRHSVDLVSGIHLVKLSRAAYGKLALLHRRYAKPEERAPPELKVEPPEQEEGAAEELEASLGEAGQDGSLESRARLPLHLRLFAMLLRYKTLRGHGFQAAVGRPVWQALQQRLALGCECFASPLNAFLPAFGSAFPDVDAPFGSRGSFFQFRPLSGSFAANPPFVHSIMDAMADHLTDLLQASASKGDHALSFAVFVPGWRECAGFAALAASPFLKRLVLVAADDHGFADGASHQRQDPYRRSPYDTACFFLQTDKAARQWPVTDEVEAELRRAFAQCLPSAAAELRQGVSSRAKGKQKAGSKPTSKLEGSTSSRKATTARPTGKKK